MKLKLIGVGFILAGVMGFGQDSNFVPEYVEDLYRLTDNSALSGTARFRSMSGAMGALGGDLSATRINPAGAGVFIDSDMNMSLAVSTDKNEVSFANQTQKESQTNFNFSQAGSMLVFDNLNSENWKAVNMGFNYEKKSIIDENFQMGPNPNLQDTAGNSFGGYETFTEGASSEFNVNVGANLKDTYFFGLGLNFSDYYKNISEGYYENNTDGNTYFYNKEYTPSHLEGSAFSFTAGLIVKPIQQFRFGIAYESPKWYNDVLEELTVYNVKEGSNEYYTDYYLGGFTHDLNSAQRLTTSAAYIFGKNGLISADFSLKDYGTARYKPYYDFLPENEFIKNDMRMSTVFRIGGEYRINNFSLRGGVRTEASPFKETQVNLGSGNETYLPYGDLFGYSLGAGFDWSSFYMHASWDHFSRDRNYLIYGNYFDTQYTVNGEDFTQEEAANILSLNLEDQGLASSVQDIKQRFGTFSLTLGFKF